MNRSCFPIFYVLITIYLQKECIEKYQFELCSKYDREYGLTSYLDKSYFVANKGLYVASLQMMLRDKLKQQVKGQVLSHDK